MREICYDGSEELIQVNDKVAWRYEDENIVGKLIDLNEKSFTVKWPDIGKVIYPIDHIAGLIKY
jgi:hypothetical protein